MAVRDDSRRRVGRHRLELCPDRTRWFRYVHTKGDFQLEAWTGCYRFALPTWICGNSGNRNLTCTYMHVVLSAC
ncbi:MAG: hypothetical protein M1826_007525 [Phylliscum demangeonii]|nr:MAG: hypothetical protein M1826_007525 [Phylliscum demangeonii]